MAATGYNLNHSQVAAKGPTPVYKDVNYATTLEPTIDQDSETLNADGKKAVTAQGAPEGSGSVGFASIDLATMAVMTGAVLSSSGTGATVIQRMVVPGNYSPPAVIWSSWIPNVDGNTTSAGLRVTIPNAKLTFPSGTFGQEEWSEMTSDLSFVADETNQMMIWEDMTTAPTFTSGVMPVNLTAPV